MAGISRMHFFVLTLSSRNIFMLTVCPILFASGIWCVQPAKPSSQRSKDLLIAGPCENIKMNREWTKCRWGECLYIQSCPLYHNLIIRTIVANQSKKIKTYFFHSALLRISNGIALNAIGSLLQQVSQILLHTCPTFNNMMLWFMN